MSAAKWIGGILGFITTGTALGALAGAALGALFDYAVDGVSNDETGHGARQAGGSENYGRGERNGFLFSLLALASYIIRADGKVMHSEMEYVRTFLRMNFGENAVEQGNDILLRLFDEQKRMNATNPYAFRDIIRQSCMQIAANMSYAQRLQLLNFLVMIAQADGKITSEEISALKEVAAYMRMQDGEVDSMLNMQGDDLESAYKVLGVSPQATDDEVRRAYRKLVQKHHPDKVAALGEDIRLASEKKLKEINKAKDRIYKARGI